MQQTAIIVPDTTRSRWAPALTALAAFDSRRMLFLVLCIAFFAAGLLSFTDIDYWMHYKTGELIVKARSIPATDPFSFTIAGKHWVVHEWLAEVIIYSVQRAGGYGADVILFTSAAMAGLLVAYHAALKTGVSRRVAVLLFLWCGLMYMPYWTVRPQVFTWLLFSVFLALVLEHRRGHNRLWLLPLLMVLWANLHLGWTFGVLLVGLYAVAVTAEKRFWGENRDTRTPWLVLAGCVAATFLTPYPGELLIYPVSNFLHDAGLDVISEWQSPDFHQVFAWPLAVSVLFLVFVGVFQSRRRDLFLPLLAVVFTLFALSAIRNQPLFALTFFAVAADLSAERWSWASRSRELVHTSVKRGLVNLALVCAVVVVFVRLLSGSPALQLHREPDTDGRLYYPAAGADFIAQNYPDARVFNGEVWGSFLLSRLYPQKVFLDSRLDVYGGDVLRENIHVFRLEKDWQDILDKYRVDLIIIEADSGLARFLAARPEWRLVFTGEKEAVYVR